MKQFSYLLITPLLFIFSCKETSDNSTTTSGKIADEKIVFGKGKKFSNDKFVGNVYQEILGKIGTQTSNVTFEPKSRTNWHLHPGGQTLLVTEGIGYHQIEGKPIQIIKKGDVINVEKNVKHWHGGSVDCGMSHIAISIDHEENPSQWFLPVSDKEYNNL